MKRWPRRMSYKPVLDANMLPLRKTGTAYVVGHHSRINVPKRNPLCTRGAIRLIRRMPSTAQIVVRKQRSASWGSSRSSRQGFIKKKPETRTESSAQVFCLLTTQCFSQLPVSLTSSATQPAINPVYHSLSAKRRHQRYRTSWQCPYEP